MIEEILSTRKRKHVQDLNIVPILDMLTTVIFFLLMSTTFIEYTKVTLPPSGTAPAKGPTELPITPKLILKQVAAGDYVSILSWGGGNPGKTEIRAKEEALREKVAAQLEKFSGRYPNEKTLQVSLDAVVPYQALVSVMDASRDYLPDSVLISYQEAMAR